jgi:hypothetical protein
MEKLIINAESQYRNTGKIICSIYPNRVYEDKYQITCKTFHEAIELIQYTFLSLSDDIHVSAF